MTKKTSAIPRPLRDADHVSKRGVPYWFAPEWTRATSSAENSYQKIKAIKEKSCIHINKNLCKCEPTVNLNMVSKYGGLTYIQGSIQKEFQDWHTDRQIDYILLGETPEAASDLIISETEETRYE
jgi:hypothetical protein